MKILNKRDGVTTLLDEETGEVFLVYDGEVKLSEEEQRWVESVKKSKKDSL